MKKLLIAVLLVLIGTKVTAESSVHEKLDAIIERLDAIEAKQLELNAAIKYGDPLNLKNGDPLNLFSNGDPQNISDILLVEEWSATKASGGFSGLGKVIKLKIKLKNISNKAIALIDGSYDIDDKLGEGIMRAKIDNDLNIQPNETYIQTSAYDSAMQFFGDMTRLLTIDPKLVDFKLDVDTLLFADGSKISFE